MRNNIVSVGVHVPNRHLEAAAVESELGTAPRGVDTIAVSAADEDALTMGFEAGRRALRASPHTSEDLQFLGFATTTPPLLEETPTPRLARILGAESEVVTRDATQSLLGPGRLLETAGSMEGPGLVVAADCPTSSPVTGDRMLGAGAAAFVLDDDEGVEITGSATHSDDVSGIRYRRPGGTALESLDITEYERSTIGECTEATFERLPISSAVRTAVIHQPDTSTPHRLGRRLDISEEAVERGTVVADIGDAGAATVPIGLALALANSGPGDATAAILFASGSQALSLSFSGGLDQSVENVHATGSIVTVVEYLRERGLLGTEAIEGGGAHVSEPRWHQQLGQRYHLEAAKCPECGEIQFPPKETCYGCMGDAPAETVRLPQEGTVVATTTIAQGSAPPEFAPLQKRTGDYDVLIVAFEVDGVQVKVPGQVIAERSSEDLIGDTVRTTLRQLYVQQGIPRYSIKFVPTTSVGGEEV